MSTVHRLPFGSLGRDLMYRLADVGTAAHGMVPGQINALTQLIADAVRSNDCGTRRYALSRAAAEVLSLWTALKGHPAGTDLRIALFRLYLALTGSTEPQHTAALRLAA